MDQIRYISYIYFLLTFFFILWNVAEMIKEKIEEKMRSQKEKVYKIRIKKELKNLKSKKKVSKEHFLYLETELKKAKNLLIYENVLLKLKENYEELVKQYTSTIADVFQRLSLFYQENDSIEKAYFSHVLSVFPELLQNDDNSILYTMMHFVFDKSIYCRENAMLFFYNKGSEKQVVHALKKISHRNLYYSVKLLADDLLKFQGDHEKLITLLLSEFDDYNINIQIAIINFIRYKKEDRRAELYQKLLSRKYNKEVELAIIRYFGTMKYQPVVDYLLTILKDKNNYNYEYRLVSSYALSIYDEKDVRRALIVSLCDEYWYVRKNSALSLVRMNLTKEELNMIESLNDSYAKEMFAYILEETKQYNNRKGERK